MTQVAERELIGCFVSDMFSLPYILKYKNLIHNIAVVIISYTVCPSSPSPNCSLFFFFTATEMPTIQQPLRDVTCQEGKTLHLEVRFTGSPPPEVIWFRGSNRVVPNNMCKVSLSSSSSSCQVVLEISFLLFSDSKHLLSVRLAIIVSSLPSSSSFSIYLSDCGR